MDLIIDLLDYYSISVPSHVAPSTPLRSHSNSALPVSGATGPSVPALAVPSLASETDVLVSGPTFTSSEGEIPEDPHPVPVIAPIFESEYDEDDDDPQLSSSQPLSSTGTFPSDSGTVGKKRKPRPVDYPTRSPCPHASMPAQQPGGAFDGIPPSGISAEKAFALDFGQETSSQTHISSSNSTPLQAPLFESSSSVLSDDPESAPASLPEEASLTTPVPAPQLQLPDQSVRRDNNPNETDLINMINQFETRIPKPEAIKARNMTIPQLQRELKWLMPDADLSGSADDLANKIYKALILRVTDANHAVRSLTAIQAKGKPITVQFHYEYFSAVDRLGQLMAYIGYKDQNKYFFGALFAWLCQLCITQAIAVDETRSATQYSAFNPRKYEENEKYRNDWNADRERTTNDYLLKFQEYCVTVQAPLFNAYWEKENEERKHRWARYESRNWKRWERERSSASSGAPRSDQVLQPLGRRSTLDSDVDPPLQPPRSRRKTLITQCGPRTESDQRYLHHDAYYSPFALTTTFSPAKECHVCEGVSCHPPVEQCTKCNHNLCMICSMGHKKYNPTHETSPFAPLVNAYCPTVETGIHLDFTTVSLSSSEEDRNGDDLEQEDESLNVNMNMDTDRDRDTGHHSSLSSSDASESTDDILDFNFFQ
jgi:hypothetical protein